VYNASLGSCLNTIKGIRYKAYNIIVNLNVSNLVRGDNKMGIELVHVGFNNIMVMNRVIAIASPHSAPIKRTIQEGRNKGLLIDMTNGRKTKAVIITDSGHIILAALTSETIAGRLQASRAESYSERGSSLLRLEQSDEKGGS
jgi:regulator of extracellular matrix RemA (YlzA/DUF370 family)